MRHFLSKHVAELADKLRVLSVDRRASSPSCSSSSSFLQVAIQFSDDTAADIMAVYEQLRDALCNDNIQLYIISDSSFAATCYDDIAASHVDSDVLVFFGSLDLNGSDGDCDSRVDGKSNNSDNNVITAISDHAVSNVTADSSDSANSCHKCKTASKGPLVIKVPKWREMDVESSLVDIMSTITANEVLRDRRMVILHETAFSSASIEQLRAALASAAGEDRVLLASSLSAAREALSRGGEADDNLSPFLLYVGDDKSSAYFALSALADVPVLVYRPPHAQGARGEAVVHAEFSSTREFRERYGGVAKIKDARLIGIIVGSMGLSSQTTRDVVSRLKLLISAANKSYYYFVIGKLNEAKLCNFPDVDVFCLVTNHNEVVRPKTYHVPVVTAFELEVGLGARQWRGDGSRLDPHYILNDDLAAAVKRVVKVFATETDDDTTIDSDFGCNSRSSSSALIATVSSEVVTKYNKEISISRYQSHSYKGLVDGTDDPANNNAVSTDIVVGKAGVAAAYSNR